MLRFNFHLIAMVANALYVQDTHVYYYIEIYYCNIFLGFFFKKAASYEYVCTDVM